MKGKIKRKHENEKEEKGNGKRKGFNRKKKTYK